MEFQDVIRLVIEPKTKADQISWRVPQIGSRLKHPSKWLRTVPDKPSSQAWGNSPRDHRRQFEGVQQAPMSASRRLLTERPSQRMRSRGSFVRQGALANVWVEPHEKGAGFVSKVQCQRKFPRLSTQFERAENSYQSGPLAGFPMVDVKAHSFQAKSMIRFE